MAEAYGKGKFMYGNYTKEMKKALNSNLEIFVTPTDSFKMKFRDVFTDTKLTHHNGKESHIWLNSSDMNYWP